MYQQLNSVITIKDKKIGKGHRPFIIAEMACAHDGDFNKALQLIDNAVTAGADAIQLQFFEKDHTVTPHHEAYPILCKIQFTKKEWTSIFNYARQQAILVFVCTYDVPSVELAIELGADGIKLNSADLSNPEVVIAVAESGIPFTLGTGASTMEEITKGLDLAIQNGAKDIVLMHGVQNFPTQISDLNIARIQLLQQVFDFVSVGYADHVAGEDPFGKIVDLIAVGLGVTILEKHITLDRSEKGIDYQAALEGEEFKQYVTTIHKGWQALGSKAIKAFTASDLKYRKFQKKSIVAAKDLNEGNIIDRASVLFIRGKEPGIAPINFDKLEGKKINRSINQYENILPIDLI